MRLKPLWVIVVAVSVSVPSVCADASMFRGGPEHSGVYNAGGVPTFSQVKWKFHTAGLVISSPAVFGDVVFVGGTDGNFYAVSSESGTLKWKFEAKSRITSSPAVSGGLVYFGAYDGNFYALDAATGQLKWKFQTAGERRYAARHLHGSQPAGETMPD
ncbi:MAG: PQQ-binding-like beta-propeller repeat protein, partial [Candidatus Sulfotelmatobacter sp.]